ncbi:MAG: haloacid dehalogenase type II [Halopseudomonas sp.]
MKPLGIGFDVFGTLVDPLQMGQLLGQMVGTEHASTVARVWREKQLEYTFRRGLMGAWADFTVCTEQALSYALTNAGIELSDQQCQQLMAGYEQLTPFADVIPALERLQHSGCSAVAFSNGTADHVTRILGNAGVLPLLQQVISVETLQTFKPDPKLYHHLSSRLGTTPSRTWLISSNPFDVIGAKHAGIMAAWIRRQQTAQFDPWGIEPDLVVGDLNELVDKLLVGKCDAR